MIGHNRANDQKFFDTVNRTQEAAGWTESTLLTLALGFIFGNNLGQKFTEDLDGIMQEERAEGTDDLHRYS